MKQNWKRLSLLMLVILTLMTSVPMVMANEDTIMRVNLGTRDLTKNQIDELVKDPEKVKARSKKDVYYLLDQAEKQINEASAKQGKQLVTQSDSSITTQGSNVYSLAATQGTDIYIGTDSSYYTTDTGNKGASADLVSGADGRWGSWWADSNSWTLGVGSSSSWAYGSSFSQVNFNNSVLVSMQAGHTYLLRYGVATSTSNYGAQMCQADFWDDTNHGVWQDYVTVDWQ